jgi:hypothetical protein
MIISRIFDIPLKEISNIKFKYRKAFDEFTPDLNGNIAYQTITKNEKDERKRLGQLKRVFTRYHIKKHPTKSADNNKTTHFSSEPFTFGTFS